MRANEALVGTLMTIGAVKDKKCATEAFSINRQNRLVQLITDFQFQLYIPVRDTWVSVATRLSVLFFLFLYSDLRNALDSKQQNRDGLRIK